MPTYQIVTLGCKLNQADSAALEHRLRLLGLTRATAPADFVVLNTCTVTGGADREARQIVRRLRRAHPGATLVVTGCYAERDGAGLAALAGIDHVVGMRDAAACVAAIAAERFGAAVSGADGDAAFALGPFGTTGACSPEESDRTRAYLKIQDGCDLRCSYCIIPSVRGGSRSLEADDVVARARALEEIGYREVVLTGVNTGDWGRDLAPEARLHDLLARLLEAAPGLRVRLNSLEPRTVTPRIVRLMAEAGGRLARHLQVPLQSGSDGVLARMRRNYRTADYARVVGTLAEAIPDAGLGADVIAGFPGESDAEFEESFRFLERSPLAYLHVFPYSARPGTPAAQAAPRAPLESGVLKDRVARLRGLGARMSLRFRSRFAGRTLQALVLRGRRPDGRLRALTDNFIDLSVDPGAVSPGSIENTMVSVRIAFATATETVASPA
jgi:threonylcarbamoyladenosine tRNA methylthiotransferase MtaB